MNYPPDTDDEAGLYELQFNQPVLADDLRVFSQSLHV